MDEIYIFMLQNLHKERRVYHWAYHINLYSTCAVYLTKQDQAWLSVLRSASVGTKQIDSNKGIRCMAGDS